MTIEAGGGRCLSSYRHPEITYTPVKGGIHAGGQHAQKNATGVRAVDKDGTTVVVRGRSLKESIKRATEEILQRRWSAAKDRAARQRQARRDEAIKPSSAVRTYDYKMGVVKDHRTGKRASIKDVLQKGKIDLLRE